MLLMASLRSSAAVASKPVRSRGELSSTVQTAAPQALDEARLCLALLEQVAERASRSVIAVHTDEWISGAAGRERRPGYDAPLRAIARRDVNVAAAWSVDRRGRSPAGPGGLPLRLSKVRAAGCDLYLHQQAIDTSTPAGRMMFQLLGVFAEFERAIITSRILAGQARARAKGVRMGRPPLPPIRLETVRKGLQEGGSIRAVAQAAGVSPSTVMRIKRASVATIRG